MNTDLASWRKRVVQLINPWRGIAPPEQSFPTFAPDLYQLALLAVGDGEAAAVLLADALLQNPADEGVALREMMRYMPRGWHSWPGGAGPAEWLSLGLRREQADRLLSIIGEWPAAERLALALHLRWDVRREDVDGWLGTRGMANRIEQRIYQTAVSLGLLANDDLPAECREHAADLIDAHDPQIGRAVRLHLLGCEACRLRAAGLQQTMPILRCALTIFFRGSIPAYFPRIVAQRRQHWRQVQLRRWRPALIVVAILALYLGLIGPAISNAPMAAAPTAAPSARSLLTQALNRFDISPAPLGILHERVQLGGEQPAILERWYSYGAPHQLRITLSRPDRAVPLLDLVSNGKELAYSVAVNNGTLDTKVLRSPMAQEILPLVLQLPDVGGLGDTLVDRQQTDVALLTQALRGTPTLLGTTYWNDRPAYLIASTTPDDLRLLLTIDQQTASLIEARRATEVGGTTSMQRIWLADQLEVVRWNALPAGVFNLPDDATVVSQLNPRQFGFLSVANLDPNAAAIDIQLPIPRELPDPILLSYVRIFSNAFPAILQMYEGRWSTTVIVTPRVYLGNEPRPMLDQNFAHGRYIMWSDRERRTTYVEFVLDRQPNHPSQMYFWHALASDDEREAMVRVMLDSITLSDAGSSSSFGERFAPPVATDRTMVQQTP